MKILKAKNGKLGLYQHVPTTLVLPVNIHTSLEMPVETEL